MYYEESIVIDRPPEAVVAAFSDLEARAHWQVGLSSSTPISGSGLTTGTQRRLVLQTGKRTMEMTETILKNQLPERLVTLYETEGVKNTSEDRFEAVEGGHTRYTSFQSFEMETLPMILLATFLPGMFRRQTIATLRAFKTYCENKEGG